MDELLTFIVIWIVLYLFNLLSKKLKKEETPARKTVSTSTGTAEKTAPSSRPAQPEFDLRELFDEITGKKQQQPAEKTYNAGYREELTEEKEADTREGYLEEPVEEPYSSEDEFERGIYKEKITGDVTISEDSPILKEEEALLQTSLAESIETVKEPEKRPSRYQRRLKQAVIWKEILDKPVSLRFPLSSRNRLS